MDLEFSRRSIGGSGADFLADLLCASPGEKEAFLRLFREDPGIRDQVLDNPKVINTLFEGGLADTVSVYLLLYVGIRFHLRRHGIQSREIADYATAVCSHFLYAENLAELSTILKPKTYISYIAAAVERLRRDDDFVRECHYRIHLGNYLLFVTGLLERVIAYQELGDGPTLQACDALAMDTYSSVADVTDNPAFFLELAKAFVPVRHGLRDFAESGIL